ncbi:hypothetical protein ABH931_004224 [Streptacidiphilus sp. MAP12-33]|uniref:SLATT domain-containing protein n=1 Tax=Streptacidiphilus sp. MAP12-33 TaxID=3156266 RepID=UPI0035174D89
MTDFAEPEGPLRRQLAFVGQEAERILVAVKRHQKGDRRRAFGLQMATVTLSACSTVLLGVRVGDPGRQVLLDIALGISALVTVLAAWEAFFSHRSLWILASRTVLRLEILKGDVDYCAEGLTGEPDREAVDAFHQRLKQIREEHETAWAKLRGREDATA